MGWAIKKISDAKITNPVLIEGLPGMGNVGKIAVDFLIDRLDAKKLMEISSYDMPHCVFVNEDNLVELPEIEVYFKNHKGRTLLFLSGDIQPIDERSCYEFCNEVLNAFQKDNGKEIITLGGIALPKVPKVPKVYCAGNDKKMFNRYKLKKDIDTNIHGVVGPIIGVSGLLTGLAGKRNIPAVALLAETFAHPNYLGITGAKEILKVIKKEFKLDFNINELDAEANDMQKSFMQAKRIRSLIKRRRNKEIKAPHDVKLDYIG